MFRVRIIKSDTCKLCKSYINALNKQKYNFELYDGDASENQKELDSWNINAFPVIQIINEGGEKIYQFDYRPAGWAPRVIDGKIRELKLKKEKKDANR